MSIPTDHHYLPRFYLRRWLDPEIERVWEYSRPYREVIVRPKPPRATCKQDGLYSIAEEDDPALREQVETQFMSPLDDIAAKALSVIEVTRQRPGSSELCDGWVRFLMSQFYRAPKRIAYLEARIREHENETTDEQESEYARVRRDSDPPTLRQLFQGNDDGLISRSRAILLRSIVDSVPIGTAILRMKWSLIGIDRPVHGLLTGDDPVTMSNGLSGQRAFVTLPVAPNLLFIAANDRAVIESFRDQKAAAFEGAMNSAICQQADRFVIGHTPRQLRFVENRLGRTEPPQADGLLGRHTWKSPLAEPVYHPGRNRLGLGSVGP